MSKWKTNKAKIVYQNNFLTVFENEVTDPNGNLGKRNMIEIGQGSVVIIAENEKGELYLVGQDRYAVSEYSWEFVSGGIKNGEEPIEAARRELAEELGLEAHEWSELMVFHPMNSLANRNVYVFLASKLSERRAEADNYEKIEVRMADAEVIKNEIVKGVIKDAFTICAFFAYFERNIGKSGN